MLRKTFWVVLIGALLISFGTVGTAQAQSILYGAAAPPIFNAIGDPLSSESSLYKIHPLTGNATLVGPIGFNDVGGMDFHPLTGILYAVGRRPASAVVVLLTIDPATGKGTEVMPLPIDCPNAGPGGDPAVQCRNDIFGRGGPVEDVSFRSDGVLFAVVGTVDIVKIDLSNGEVKPAFPGSSLGFPFLPRPIDSLAFSPDDSMLCARAFEANFFCTNPADPSAPFGLILIGIPVRVRIGGPLFGVVVDGSRQVTAMSALDAQPVTGTLFGVVTEVPFLLPPCIVAPNFPDGCLVPPIPKCFDGACLVTVTPNPTDTTGFLGYRADPIGFTVAGLDAIAWSIFNTPAGTNVTVTLAPVTLTFTEVTQAGNTTLTSSTAGPPPPSGFRLGNPPTYFELSTTAVFSGPIQICIDYSGIAFGSTASLKLQHFENGAWVDVTTSLDTVNKIICGVAGSLSPFAIFEPEAVDTTPPVVTAPTGITVPATEATGARGNAWPALAAFLAGGSAIDNVDPAPVRLAPQVSGVDVDNNTLLPLGTTPVTFRFSDASGNVGTATANLTVALGLPRISGTLVGKGVQSAGVLYVDVRLTNTGTGNARNLAINQFPLRTLFGSGTVTYNTSLSPALPLAIGNLDVGASTTIRLFLNVPSTVTKFSVTESGPVQDAGGTTYSYSAAQVVYP